MLIHCIVYFFLIVVSLFIAATCSFPIPSFPVFNKALKNHFQAIHILNLILFQVYRYASNRLFVSLIDFNYTSILIAVQDIIVQWLSSPSWRRLNRGNSVEHGESAVAPLIDFPLWWLGTCNTDTKFGGCMDEVKGMVCVRRATSMEGKRNCAHPEVVEQEDEVEEE